MFSMKAHMQKETEKPPARLPESYFTGHPRRPLNAPEEHPLHNKDQNDTVTLTASYSPPRPGPVFDLIDCVQLTPPYECPPCMFGLIKDMYYSEGLKRWMYLFFDGNQQMELGWVEESWLRPRDM